MTRGQDYPLFSAAQTNDVEKARRALKEGARLWARDAAEETPLQIAARFGSPEVCRWVIEESIKAGADPFERYPERVCHAIEIAAHKTDRIEILEMLLAHATERQGRSALSDELLREALKSSLKKSIAKDEPAAIEALARAGADVDQLFSSRSGHSARPLHRAVLELSENALRALLSLGADPNGVDSMEQAPLCMLFVGDFPRLPLSADSELASATLRVCAALAQAGADVTLGERGASPLELAQLHGPAWLLEALTSFAQARELAACAGPAKPAQPPASFSL